MAEKRAYDTNDRRGFPPESKRVKTSNGRSEKRHHEQRQRQPEFDAYDHERRIGSAAAQRKGRAHQSVAPNRDRDHHASSLAALDAKHPRATKLTAPSEYVPSKPFTKQKALPPLPEIKDPTLEECVFTHVSMLKSNQSDAHSYERLEFVGDAYLELIATRIIYSRFLKMDVGRQSQLRESLVRNDTLSKFAEGYDFDKRLSNRLNKDPKSWKKIMGDVFEAYVAAVVLSDPVAGFDIAENWLTELWADILLNSKGANPIDYGDSKVQLQNHLMSPGIKLNYREEKPSICDRSVGLYTFFIGVYLHGWGYENEWLGSGEGKSMAEARSSAAADALKRNSEVLQKAHQIKIETDRERKRLREEKEKLGKEPSEKEKGLAEDAASEDVR